MESQHKKALEMEMSLNEKMNSIDKEKRSILHNAFDSFYEAAKSNPISTASLLINLAKLVKEVLKN